MEPTSKLEQGSVAVGKESACPAKRSDTAGALKASDTLARIAIMSLKVPPEPDFLVIRVAKVAVIRVPDRVFQISRSQTPAID